MSLTTVFSECIVLNLIEHFMFTVYVTTSTCLDEYEVPSICIQQSANHLVPFGTHEQTCDYFKGKELAWEANWYTITNNNTMVSYPVYVKASYRKTSYTISQI